RQTRGAIRLQSLRAGFYWNGSSPVVSDIGFTIVASDQQPVLALAAANNRTFSSATIHVKHRGATPRVFFEIELGNVRITHAHGGFSSGDTQGATDAYAISARQFTWKFTEQDQRTGALTAYEV